MGFGGGGGSDIPDEYSTYKSGDFAAFSNAFNTQQKILEAQARGEISDAAANAQLGAIRNGTPGTPVTSTVSVAPRGTLGGAAGGRGAQTLYAAPPQAPAGSNPGGGRGNGTRATNIAPPSTQRQQTTMVGAVPGVDLDALRMKASQDPAAQMEIREMVRQGKIGLGRIGIDKQFSRFNDDYYNKYQHDYQDFYTPELNRQYGKVVDKTTAALAGRGTLNSSIGNDAFADLAHDNTQAQQQIANDSVDAGKKLKAQVENAKSNMYGLNESSANPEAVNNAALGQATALVAPPTFSPLGQIFADALSGISNFASARSNRPTKNYTSPYATGQGSAKVIG